MPEHANGFLINTHNNRSYRLYESDTTLGRGTHNDIVIADDATLSRSHALFRCQDGFFVLHDRGAKTSILLNGVSITAPQRLQHEDEILLGETLFRFVTVGT